MAVITAAGSGDWSNTATWTGGVVPVDGDSVKAGTFTITFDVDINQPNTVLEATTGNFRHSGTGTRTVVAQANVGNHTTGGLIQNTSSGTLVFDGEVRGGSGTTALGAQNASSGTLTVTTATGGSGSSAHGANNASSGTLTVTTATGGSGWSAHGANNASSGTLTVTTATGGSGSSAFGARNNSSGTLTVTTATGGSGSFATGARNESSGTLTVTTAIGGSGTQSHGAINNSSGTLTVTTATGGSGSNATGASNASNGTLNCDLAIGNNYGPTGTDSNLCVGVFGSNNSAGVTTVKRIQFGPYGAVPITGSVLLLADATNSAQFRTVLNGATKTLTDTSAAADYPTAANVRSGTVYANGDRTGTLAVPAANQVAVGVAVDNTTGTAVLTAAGIRSELATELGRIDAAISTRLADADYDAPDAATVATAVRSELTTELGRIDATVSSRLATSGYTTPPTASANATAVRSELATELARVDATVSSRLAASAYSAPDPVDVNAIANATADAVWDETLAGHLTAGSTGAALGAAGNASDPWTAQLPGGYPAGSAGVVVSNIVNQIAGSAASIAVGLSDNKMTVYRGDSWAAIIADTSNITGRTALYWTVKRDSSDSDADATIQVEETAGLVRLNGATTTAGNGMLTVTNAPTGDVAFRLEAAATAALAPGEYVWDVQVTKPGSVETLGTGTLTVTADVTRTTS